FNQRAAEPRQKAEVQQSRIQHLEQVQQRLLQRIEKLKEEKANLVDGTEDEEIGQLTEQLAELDLARSEEHTSELQSRENLVCRPPQPTLFPYTTLFRSL